MKPFILGVLLLTACTNHDNGPSRNLAGSSSQNARPVTAPAAVSADQGIPIRLWSTIYYSKVVDPVPVDGMPLRDPSGTAISPPIAIRDLCLAAIEGTVNIEGKVYNYASSVGPRQAYCGTSRTQMNATLVRWKVSPHPYGIGNRNNPLQPFRTLACDQTTPWITAPGGNRPAKFGERILVPAAQGTRLPDGSIHDGVFTCGDTGGNIRGNHTDIFVGSVRGGTREANSINPFDFVGHNETALYDAYILN